MTADQRLVIDACVAVKWFVPEVLRAEALRVAHPSFRLIAPDILYDEVVNTLLKKSRNGEMFRQDIGPSLNYLTERVELLDRIHLRGSALALAVERGLGYFDALYSALAAEEGCRVVTADERLIRALSPELEGVVLSLADVPLI